MFNVSGTEMLIILVLALIVLGPEKLPVALRKAGRVVGEVRRMANGFQSELRGAMQDDEWEPPRVDPPPVRPSAANATPEPQAWPPADAATTPAPANGSAPGTDEGQASGPTP